MENNLEHFRTNYYEHNYEREEAYLRAKKKVKSIIGFYWHLFSYVVINAFILYLIYVNLNGDSFWSFNVFSTVIFWGIGLLFHFFGVFGADFIFGKAWEQRKIKDILEKENKYKNWD